MGSYDCSDVTSAVKIVTLFAASLTVNLSAFRADVVVCDKSDDGLETKEG